MEDVLNRQRRERKELQAKIQALKKSAPKSDKKRRKEAMEEVARMETEMEQRHAAELKSLQDHEHNGSLEVNGAVAGVEERPASPEEEALAADGSAASSEHGADHNDIARPHRVTRAQKRRDKKSREARQREENIRAAAEDTSIFQPKIVEAKLLRAKLQERNLILHQVASDGDCLYNAIRHQLRQRGQNPLYNVKELRQKAAEYIFENKDMLIYYMTKPETGELLTDQEFEAYCDAVANTHTWGGQIELKALSSVLKIPIEVLQAEGPPTIQGETEFDGPNLLITYHRHMYSLGEHYNSTLPGTRLHEKDDEDSSDESFSAA